MTEGVGKVKKTKNYDELFVEIALRNGVVMWHAQNFRPKDDMNIQSAERLHYDDFKLGTFYDRSDRYMPGSYILEDSDKSEEQRRILTNLPFPLPIAVTSSRTRSCRSILASFSGICPIRPGSLTLATSHLVSGG